MYRSNWVPWHEQVWLALTASRHSRQLKTKLPICILIRFLHIDLLELSLALM